MTCRLIAVALLLPVSWGSAQEDKKDAAVRVIDIQGLVKGAQRGKVTAPTVIANEDELKTVFKDSSEAVAKKVNFKSEKLLFFSWGGSGQDKLTFAVDKGEKGPLVLFHYKAGLTRDLRPHVHLFAIPKDATWRVATKKEE